MRAGPAGPLVVVTRDERGNDEFSARLRRLGARVSALAAIRILPARTLAPLEHAIGQLGAFEWLVFTSGHAVDATCAHGAWRSAWRALAERPRVAAVGPATAARLAAHGIVPDLVPRETGAAGLAAALVARAGGLRGTRVLWPRSDIAHRDLPEALEAQGAVVCDPPVYRTVSAPPAALAEFRRDLHAGRIAAVAFLSPSSALGLAAGMLDRTLGELQGRTAVASIGPKTSSALAALGAPATIEPPVRTSTALAEAILQHVGGAAGGRA